MSRPARIWWLLVFVVGLTGCFGPPAPTLDPEIDGVIAEAVEVQAARDAWVEAVRQGGAPARAAEVDEAWHEVFGQPPRPAPKAGR